MITLRSNSHVLLLFSTLACAFAVPLRHLGIKGNIAGPDQMLTILAQICLEKFQKVNKPAATKVNHSVENPRSGMVQLQRLHVVMPATPDASMMRSVFRQFHIMSSTRSWHSPWQISRPCKNNFYGRPLFGPVAELSPEAGIVST